MFAPRYFAPRHFAPRYYPPAKDGDQPQPEQGKYQRKMIANVGTLMSVQRKKTQ